MCLFVAISYYCTTAQPISGITYAGVPLVHVTGAPYNNSSYFADLWYLANPATGANNLVVSFSTQLSFTGMLGAAVFSGVNQASPVGPAVIAVGAINIPIPVNGGGIDCTVDTGTGLLVEIGVPINPIPVSSPSARIGY
jgi:hypothetical protein